MKKIVITSIIVLLVQTLFSQNFINEWNNYINHGKNFYLQEKYSDALAQFKLASKVVPTDTLAYSYIINCAQFTKQAGEAFNAIKSLEKLKFSSPDPYELCIPILMSNNFGMENILQVINSANVKYPNQEKILLLELQLYHKYSLTNIFLEKINTFQILFPRNYESYLLYINVLNEQMTDSTKALEIAKKGQELFPDSLSFYKLEYSYQLKHKEYDAARELIQRLIEKNSNDPELYYNLSLLQFEEENYEEAIATCQKAINLKPDYVEAIYNIGTFYYYEGMIYSSAVSDMTVGQFKEEGKDYLNSALNNFLLAKPYFESAILYNPSDLDAYENLNTINVLIENIQTSINQNQDWAEETEQDLPLFISNLTMAYQAQSAQLSQDSAAVLHFDMLNMTDSTLRNIEVLINQPITTAGLNYENKLFVDSIAPKADIELSLVLNYNYRAADVAGIELAEGAQDKLRIFAQTNYGKVADLQEIVIAIKRNNSSIEETETETTTENETEIKVITDSVYTPQNYLIIIGVSDYLNWTDVTYAQADAQEFKNTLIQHYTFEENNAFELYNQDATHEKIRNALIKIKNEIREEDNLVIYFSGHGFYNSAFDYAAWVPYDAKTDALEDYIITSQIIQYLSSIHAKHIVVFSDACFSESLLMPAENFTFSTENIDESSRWAFSSGSFEYVADENFQKESAFAKNLLQIMQENTAEKLAINEIIYKTTEALKQQNITTAVGRPLNIQENSSGRYVFTKK